MARSFDGSSGKISFTTIAAQESFNTLSYNVHVYRNGPGESDYGIVFEGVCAFYNDNGDVGWGLVFNAGFSGTNGIWSVPYPSNGAFNIYTITYDGSATTNDPVIYKNGVAETVTERQTPVGTFVNTKGSFYIGNRTADDGLTWNGRLAEVAEWNRILSAEEAAILGKNASAKFLPRGLVFYTPLIGNNSPEIDIVGGITGTISGTSATKVEHPRIIFPTNTQTMKFASGAAAPAVRFNIMGTVGM